MPDGGVIRARYDAGYSSDYNPSPPTAGTADAEIYSAGTRLRNWARYLAKNSSIVKATLDARVAKGVGCGLRYEPMIRDRRGNLLEKLNEAVRLEHARWSEAADVTGELSRAEVERLVWRDWDTVGEVFGRRVYRGRTRERVGYQVQLIRSELVPYGWVAPRGAVMGIDRDEWGQPTQYWVYPYARAADTWFFSLPSLNPVAIPAEQIAHLRRQEELDATRGVTLFHAVIFRASDIAEYQQSHRRAARASANLFASINRSIDFDPTNELAPEGEGTNQLDETQRQLNLLDLTILDYLKPGEAVNFHAPTHPNQNAVEFVNQELRQFAASCRVAFSWIAYVFDRAYAAQRTELVHAWEMITEDRGQFVRDFAMPLLYREPLRLMLAEGRLPVRELRRADPRTLYDVRIDGPAMPSLDPKTDREAAEIDQRNGWESRHGNIRRFGRDPTQVDAERMSDPFPPEADTGPQETEREASPATDGEQDTADDDEDEMEDSE